MNPPSLIENPDDNGYRYETFRAALLLNDARFSPDALKPGKVLPDRMLVRPDGEKISLRDVSDGRPIVLVTGSITCPLSVSTLPMLSELYQRYHDRVAFAFIYTREAHPGENFGQPATLPEKVDHARLLKEIHGLDWPVLVDDLDGTLHTMLDTKQNSVHILGSDGTIMFRALFAGDTAVEKAIAAIAGGGQPHKNLARGKLAGPMMSIGYIDETLRQAGPQAYRDVIKAVPPMAMMAVLSMAFPFLPKVSRGWAAAGTLMVGGAAILWGLAKLFP